MEQNRIGALRRELGLNQKELAEKLNVGQTTISAWETGRNKPDYKSVRNMAQLFEVSPDYLLGFNNDEERRGLSEAEYQAKIRRKLREWEKADRKQKLEEFIHDQQLEQSGLTEKEMAELQEESHWDAWKSSGLPVQFETYKAVQLMEQMTKAEREIIFKIIDLVTKLKNIK